MWKKRLASSQAALAEQDRTPVLEQDQHRGEHEQRGQQNERGE